VATTVAAPKVKEREKLQAPKEEEWTLDFPPMAALDLCVSRRCVCSVPATYARTHSLSLSAQLLSALARSRVLPLTRRDIIKLTALFVARNGEQFQVRTHTPTGHARNNMNT